MFRDLQPINARPAVFSRLTTADLWIDPYVSAQMLRFHLDGSVDLSSRRTESIDAAAVWIADTFHLGEGASVLDLGCGPGLYTSRFARSGAKVTGVDFSVRSIEYARAAAARAGLAIDYVNADYLAWETETRFDLVTMIMLDYCAMPPAQRLALLTKIERLLAPGGAFLFDVWSTVALDAWEEKASYTQSAGDGFWSAAPYFEFYNSFAYPEESVTLEKFVVVEADRTRTIYNWLQCFSPESVAAELTAGGLEVACLLGDVAGRPFDARSREFAVVARRAVTSRGRARQ